MNERQIQMLWLNDLCNNILILASVILLTFVIFQQCALTDGQEQGRFPQNTGPNSDEILDFHKH